VKPLLLDLFCGAGGCSVGYHRAGFDVVGVDLHSQPRYPFDFVQGDALEYLAGDLGDFDAIHASPPCQAYAGSTAWRGDRSKHPDLIGPTRALLEAAGLPYVIENVPDARRLLRNPVRLCGSMFSLPVRRHRYFETNWPLSILVNPCHHRQGDLAFEHKGERAYADALGCSWMTSVEARQAIPPAYTSFIGAALMQHLRSAAA
jgi:DNA (cytosine-5)-methyltransferase 1